jgi:hypothetical protein
MGLQKGVAFGIQVYVFYCDFLLVTYNCSSQVHYVKAHAYRIKPLAAKGFLSVDGEPYPFEEFQVEVHQGMGTLLSLYGHYAAKLELRAPASGSRHKGT